MTAETYIDWSDHGPVEITGPIQSAPDRVPSEHDFLIQWVDDGEGFVEPGPGIVPEALERMLDNISTGSSANDPITEFASVGFDNNWSILSHWIWNDNYTDQYDMDVGRFILIDDTGRTWRQQRADVIKDEFEAANPGKFVVNFEWESDDHIGVLGSWSNRRILFNAAYETGGWVAEYSDYREGSGEFPARETVPVLDFDPPRPTVRVYIPDFSIGTQPGGWGSQAAILDRWRWAPNAVLPYHLTDLELNNLEVEIAVPDATFDARSIPLTVPLGFGGFQQHTNGVVVWALPRIQDVVNGTRVYEARMPIDNPRLVSVYQPPRWRLSYVMDDIPSAPIRRTFPRDDGLAGGARRNYPPSRAAQSGNRNVGGYL